jgi:nickel transport protein
MRRRFLALTLALAVLLGGTSAAQAHRLKAACRFLPGRMVRVESWFDNGETPKKGHVQVRGAGGQVLREGQLNREGIYQFEAPEGEALQVIVEAGEGHRAEVAISPGQLVTAAAPETTAPAEDRSASPTEPSPATGHEETLPIKDILTGVGLLIAVAAFVLSLRNARALRELRQSHRENPR